MIRNRWVRWTLMAVALIVLAIFAADWVIVTDEEQVAQTLHDLARAIAQNDPHAVVGLISVDSPELQREARLRMAQVVVQRATVKRNLEVQTGRARGGPVADARFNGVIVVTDKLGTVSNQTIARYFVVSLRKEEGRWRVSRYEDLDPIRRR